VKEFLNDIKGDKGIWVAFLLLAVISFLPTYSASTNLAYVLDKGTTSGYFFKHLLILILGFIILYITHKIPYRYFSGGSVFLMPFAFGLLIYTMTQKTTIAGATAARWITIPIVDISFQTSTFAGVILMIYVSRYFSKIKDKEFDFKHSVIYLWAPVGLILAPILPSNFSTAALLFMAVVLVSILVGYPFKYLLKIFGFALVALTLFIFIGREFSTGLKNKTETWKNRIVNFNKPDPEADYQIEKAKMAIATGGAFGLGAGKSVQKNFLPQSSSDFIFAIIVEEWGMAGGLMVILLYSLLLFRIWVVAKKSTTIFSTLLVIGVGFPLIIQAIVNMMVATNLLPVTGQTLPLLSSGGTSIWMTCLAIGIVLSVSVANAEGDKAQAPSEENPLDVLYETVD
jgi:cell division protein FtsW